MANETMTVEVDFPPNYQAVCDAFPWVARTRGVIFAWDRIVFNPDGIDVTPSLLAHEIVHANRQAGNPVAWWDKYLTNANFRFLEEVPAHIEEYAYVKGHERLRVARRHYLNEIAERLAGPLYGRLTTIEKAKTLLKKGVGLLPANPQPQGA